MVAGALAEEMAGPATQLVQRAHVAGFQSEVSLKVGSSQVSSMGGSLLHRQW
jgi:hypothetical protein